LCHLESDIWQIVFIQIGQRLNPERRAKKEVLTMQK
jgi:hypothetical protein